MELSKTRFAVICIIFILAVAVSGFATAYVIQQNEQIVGQYNSLVKKYNEIIEYLNGQGGNRQIGLSAEVHSRIRIYRGTELILDEYNAGAVTDIGDNMTLAWIFGDSDYGVADYMYNATYISIGNQGTLNTASTQLPGEWNRTAGTVEDQSQSWLNITCTFYPDTGPYTADCIGLNWKSSGDLNLWAYDTFSEVTGIDDTFTINVEFKITVSHT